jgi:hypothetical protein
MAYEKEKEEAERMLKVIEEPPRFIEILPKLTNLIYTLGIMTVVQSIVLKELNEKGLIKKNG